MKSDMVQMNPGNHSLPVELMAPGWTVARRRLAPPS